MAELTTRRAEPLVLELRGISKRFGSTHALREVDLRFPGGAVTALVGENGAGKSTLMNVLAGSVRPDAGRMRLSGAEYAPRDPFEARGRGVAVVRQELALAPHLSVAENVFLGVEPGSWHRVDRAAMRARTAAALGVLDRADIGVDTRAGDLPLAARQMIEIARAVAHDARIVIFDEPTSALPHHDVETLLGLIRTLRERGCAVVFISHVLEDVKAVADTIAVLRDGQVAACDLPPTTSAHELVLAMAGREIGELYPRSVRIRGEAVLTLDHVAGEGLPYDASLTLHRGEILGIAGVAGAGRSELLRTIFGLQPAIRGSMRVHGRPLAGLPHDRLAQGVGLLSEDRAAEGVALTRSIAENVAWSRLPGRAAWVSPAAMRQAARAIITRLRISCRGPEQTVGELSGGNQQKVALGRLVHHGVDVLLLDEPTRGVDVATKAELYRLFDALVAEQGKAIVWVSSYVPELLGMADRIAVLRSGRLMPARRAAELTEHDVLIACVG